MAGAGGERRALLLTALLVALVGALAWLGVRTGHVVLPSAAAPTSTTVPSPPRSPSPTPAPSPTRSPGFAVAPPDQALEAAFAAKAAELGGAYALAWVDAAGLHLLGSAPQETAWSTIKVPLAIAAVSRGPTEQTWRQVESAITRSDNEAALELWTALGPPEEAARAVDEVLAAYGSAEARTEHLDVRPPFSSFGQTVWSTPSQARFAGALACVPESSAAGRVRTQMGLVLPEHRWGIGVLEAAHLKGGWGPEPGGAYVLRQLGDGQVAGQRYALALTARSATGSYAQATAEATALVRWWAETVAPSASGFGCPAG